MNHSERIACVYKYLDDALIPPLAQMVARYLTEKDDVVEWEGGRFEVIAEAEKIVLLESIEGKHCWTFNRSVSPDSLHFGHAFTDIICCPGDVMIITTRRVCMGIGTREDFESIKALLVRCGIADW